MKLIAEIANQEYTLELKRDGAHLTAEIDGRTYTLGAHETEKDMYLLIHDNRVYECHLEHGASDTTSVHIRQRIYDVHLIDPKRLRDASMSGADISGRVTIKAQMPGKIVRVMIEAGASVEAGQGLVIIEAMKMQNELKAPRDGVVSSVNAEAGATVNAGDVLLVIE
ncbi:MAG: hypothetical protein NVSMB56_05950 [Pyrinomonadaceae bacterium]